MTLRQAFKMSCTRRGFIDGDIELWLRVMRRYRAMFREPML